MQTDWVLIARLGTELAERLGEGRVDDAGLLADGRVAIALRRRGGRAVAAFDLFGTPPMVTLEDASAELIAAPGFVRALAAALRGTMLAQVRARRGDRLLRWTFTSRSRFGVGDAVEVYAELVPRFGNAVLVKREVVVAAAKEFTLAENAVRAVAAGFAYALPPLPPPERLTPKAVANYGDAAVLEAALESGAALRDPLYVYRRDGRIVAAHVVPLDGLPDAECTRENALLDVLTALRAERSDRGEREGSQRRRDALLRRLTERERKLRDELDDLAAKRARIARRDELREEGERIFATLHERDPQEQDEAKERAAELFAGYKKLGASQEHVTRREGSVSDALAAIDALRWEAQRAADRDVGDVETAAAATVGDRRARKVPAAAQRQRRREPLERRTASGSRILVGRTPLENADLTFRIARPMDLWFHAQAIPGAHVVLARDDRTPPPDEDVAAAAALAAYHSKARASAKVPVDYAQRRYVRKQRDAAPGLVWYTNAKTIVVEPRDDVPEGDA